MPYYALVGTLSDLINQFEGDKYQVISEIYLRRANSQEEKDTAANTIKVDLPRLPFLGTHEGWQKHVSTYVDPSLTEMSQYVQANMDARGILLILSAPPLYKPFIPEEPYPDGFDLNDFLVHDKAVSTEFAYIDDQNRCCGLCVAYADPEDPTRWSIALVKNTNLSTDQRQVFVLTTEKISYLKVDAKTNHLVELTSADALNHSLAKSKFLANINNTKLCLFIDLIMQKDGSVSPSSNLINLFISRGTYSESRLPKLENPDLFELFPSTSDGCRNLLNNKILVWLSDYALNCKFTSKQLQSLMTQKGALYGVLTALFETHENNSRFTIINELKKAFNNPVLQQLIDYDDCIFTSHQLQILMTQKGNLYQALEEILLKGHENNLEIEQLIQTAVHLDRMGFDSTYIELVPAFCSAAQLEMCFNSKMDSYPFGKHTYSAKKMDIFSTR